MPRISALKPTGSGPRAYFEMEVALGLYSAGAYIGSELINLFQFYICLLLLIQSLFDVKLKVKILSQVFKAISDWSIYLPIILFYLPVLFENLSKVAADLPVNVTDTVTAEEGDATGTEELENTEDTEEVGEDQTEGDQEQTPENLEAADQTGN